MLTEKEQAYYVGLIKRYRLLAKLTLIPMSVPVGLLLYCSIKSHNNATVPLDTLIIGMIFFIAAWTGFMSFHIKADVINDIVNGPGLEEKTQSEG